MSNHIHSPAPQRTLKRELLDCEDGPSSGKRQPTERPILDWLSRMEPVQADGQFLSRPHTAGPSFHTAAIEKYPSEIGNMSQQAEASQVIARPPFLAPSIASSIAPSIAPSRDTASARTNDSRYPGVLFANGVIMDRSGTKIPSDIKAFVTEHILEKQRASPPLTQAEINEVISVAGQVVDSSEGAVHRLFNTAMFPRVRGDIIYGGNVAFSSAPVPRIPGIPIRLATPKPDRFYGYKTFEDGAFTRSECGVLIHPHMTKYARPTSESAFPFLIVEVRSEARGGTLWHAENHAAGSGSHCVNSMRWLMQHGRAEANGLPKPTEIEIEPTKTIAFSVCMTARQVVLYVHSYSNTEQEHLMSSISLHMLNRAEDIQKCRNEIKNIIDFALDIRKQDVKNSLNELYPIPLSWPQITATRARSSTTSASATSSLVN